MKNDKSGYIYNRTTPELAGLSGSNPNLQKGDKGADVRSLQINLVKAGFKLPKYGTDGIFGSETTAAVISFQTANGLPGTGIVDAATWAKLKSGTGGSSGGQNILSQATNDILKFSETLLNYKPGDYIDYGTPATPAASAPKKENNTMYWLAGGAVGVTLLGVLIAASGDDK
jgi:peptidoglycan hydrolase-like protein with peptidoglycan-binding domain